MTRPEPARVAEAAATSAAAALLGATAGSVIGLGVPLALVAGANGAISGYRGIYRWSSPTGAVAFTLDSTWAGITTTAGLAAHVIGALRGQPGYAPALSRRQNRHVYARGFQLRKGFATTFGNVIAGAGDVSHPRRAKLVTDHEDVHAWQARWFGPAYPLLYGGWAVGGAVAGAAVWATGRRPERLGQLVESCAYYLNPFEWWAYSRDDHWPPSGLASRLGWTRPAVRPFSSR